MREPSSACRQYARRFSENFALFVSTSEPVFCCPTCLLMIPLSQLNCSEESTVDESHVYPRGAGGKRVTLECHRCNTEMNEAGDNEIVNAFQLHRAFGPGQRERELMTTIRATGIDIRVKVTPGQGGPHLQAVGEDNNDVNRALIEQAIAAAARFTAGVNLLNEKVLFGYLHSAHLLLFATFGYGYTSSTTGHWIKKILDAKQIAAGDVLVLDLAPSDLSKDQTLFKVGAFSQDGEAAAVGVTLPHYDPRKAARVVLLPLPVIDGPDYYDQIRRTWPAAARHLRFTPFETRHRRLSVVEHAYDVYTLAACLDRRSSDEHSFVLAVARAAGMDVNAAVDVEPIFQRLGLPDEFAATSIPSIVDEGMLNLLPVPYRAGMVRLTTTAAGRILANPQARRIVEFGGDVRLLRCGELNITKADPSQ